MGIIGGRNWNLDSRSKFKNYVKIILEEQWDLMRPRNFKITETPKIVYKDYAKYWPY